MEAGRRIDYRDNEFRNRESDFQSSRKDFAYARVEYEQIENGGNRNGRALVRELRDKFGDRVDRNGVRVQKDVGERGVVSNGGHQSVSGRSDSGTSGGGGGLAARGPLRQGMSRNEVDREPGELSVESGSDDLVDLEMLAGNKDNDLMDVAEEATQTSAPDKKRKFSPIIWDRDDNNGATDSSKSRVTTLTNNLPPPPPLPKEYIESVNVIPDGGVEISRIESGKAKVSKSAPLKGSEGNVASEPTVESPLEEEKWNNNLEENYTGYEDYVPTRNISSSRWVAGNDSPIDEGEIVEEQEAPQRRKSIPHLESLGSRGKNKSLTPELGSVKREGSDDQRPHLSSLSEGESDGYEKGDRTELDEDHGGSDQGVGETDDERDSRRTPELVGPPTRSVNMLQGCRSVDEFERLNKIDEGTYGVVFRAKDKKSGEIVALKKVKMEKEREGFPLTSLREINILLSLHHPSIVDVKEVVVGSNLDSIFMVMEYMEHDLKGLMESMKQPFSQSEVKCLMLQLLEGIKYLHDNWVLHRDLKTSNLLLNNRGELKICDFGLARQYGSPLKPYTQLVVTLWYRAPELLLGTKQYSTAIDMWSLGCIMAELLSKQPLFNGKTEVEQLDKIFRTLGTPSETIWPGFSKLPGVKVNFVKHQYNLLRKKFPATSFTGSPVLSDAGFDLLNKLLTYDPEKRITADAALKHQWFREVPLPKSKDFMPTFPAQHAQDRRLRRIMKSPDPLEELRKEELRQAELGTGGLFG